MVNKYSDMQQNQYDQEASKWSLSNRDPVVGSFDQHNNWSDYDHYLFKSVEVSGKHALEFGCGPGRNIVKFSSSFKQIDGVDISSLNLENAKLWCESNNVKPGNLYKNNGIDLSEIGSNIYDIVFSTICMQHICVHSVRVGLMKEFFRVLKSGGHFCAQMGYGTAHPRSVDYYDDYYDATMTNGGCDTRVTDPDQLKGDLEAIGFTEFDYDIRPVGPGDGHSNWIFFRAKKP